MSLLAANTLQTNWTLFSESAMILRQRPGFGAMNCLPTLAALHYPARRAAPVPSVSCRELPLEADPDSWSAQPEAVTKIEAVAAPSVPLAGDAGARCLHRPRCSMLSRNWFQDCGKMVNDLTTDDATANWASWLFADRDVSTICFNKNHILQHLHAPPFVQHISCFCTKIKNTELKLHFTYIFYIFHTWEANGSKHHLVAW